MPDTDRDATAEPRTMFMDLSGAGGCILRLTPPSADDGMISVWQMDHHLPLAVFVNAGETVRTLLDIGRLATVP